MRNRRQRQQKSTHKREKVRERQTKFCPSSTSREQLCPHWPKSCSRRRSRLLVALVQTTTSDQLRKDAEGVGRDGRRNRINDARQCGSGTKSSMCVSMCISVDRGGSGVVGVSTVLEGNCLGLLMRMCHPPRPSARVQCSIHDGYTDGCIIPYPAGSTTGSLTPSAQ